MNVTITEEQLKLVLDKLEQIRIELLKLRAMLLPEEELSEEEKKELAEAKKEIAEGLSVTSSPRLRPGASSFSFRLGFIGCPPTRFAGSMAYATRFQRLEVALRHPPHLLVWGHHSSPIPYLSLRYGLKLTRYTSANMGLWLHWSLQHAQNTRCDFNYLSFSYHPRRERRGFQI
ncbi:MAG: hypothetical protein NDF52_07690 [archaeon YNP-WB-062]|nr:hypothetical protein [Candidatus Culexarchaeum yellowstonense]